MDKFTDNDGKRSMIRTITYFIVLTALGWGTIEVIYSLFNNDFTIHTNLIFTVLGIGVTGKVGQKIVENINKKKNETIN